MRADLHSRLPQHGKGKHKSRVPKIRMCGSLSRACQLLTNLKASGAPRVIHLQYLYQQISAATKVFRSAPACRTILSLTILHGPFQQGLKVLYLLGFPVAKYD